MPHRPCQAWTDHREIVTASEPLSASCSSTHGFIGCTCPVYLTPGHLSLPADQPLPCESSSISANREAPHFTTQLVISAWQHMGYPHMTLSHHHYQLCLATDILYIFVLHCLLSVYSFQLREDMKIWSPFPSSGIIASVVSVSAPKQHRHVTEGKTLNVWPL